MMFTTPSTTSITTEDDTPPILFNTIDRNFLPLKSCNGEWAHRTYDNDCYKFPSFTHKNQQSREDKILHWCDTGNTLRTSLTANGMLAATNELSRIATQRQLRRRDGQLPVNFNDILNIIGDITWYQEDIEYSRELIYILCYRIFRVGYNQWALQAADQWMRNHRLQYTPIDMNEPTMGKGFAYSLTVQRASLYIGKQMQQRMRRTLNEFMVVRKKICWLV